MSKALGRDLESGAFNRVGVTSRSIVIFDVGSEYGRWTSLQSVLGMTGSQLLGHLLDIHDQSCTACGDKLRVAIPTLIIEHQGVNAQAVKQDGRSSDVTCTPSPAATSSIVSEKADSLITRPMDTDNITASMPSEPEYICMNAGTHETDISQTDFSEATFNREASDQWVSGSQSTRTVLGTRNMTALISNEYVNQIRATVHGDKDITMTVNNSPNVVSQRRRNGDALLHTILTSDREDTSGKHTDEVGYRLSQSVDTGDSDTEAYMTDTDNTDACLTVYDDKGRRDRYWIRHGEDKCNLPMTGTQLIDASHATSDGNNLHDTLVSMDRRKAVDISKYQSQYNRVTMSDVPNTITDNDNGLSLTVDRVETQYQITTNADFHATSTLADYADIAEPNLEMECEIPEIEYDSEDNFELCNAAATNNPYKCLLTDHPYILAPRTSSEQPCKRRLKCHHCGIVFRYSGQHTTHLRTHFTQNTFHCDLCCDSRANNTKSGSHKSKDDVGRPMCKRCGKLLVNGPPKLTCNICGVTYGSGAHIPKHTCRSKQKNKMAKRKGEYGRKTFTSKSNMIVHTRKRTEDQPFSCEYCEQYFSAKQPLTVHRRTHTGDRPFLCNICNKTFSRKEYVVIHQRTHTGERPYKCTSCSKAFKRRNSLVVHKRIHTEERPYRCTHCTKAFSTTSLLNIHKRVHTAVKPYQCTQCSKAFSTKQTLVSHMTTHTGERPFQCTHCSKAYSTSGNLVVHNRIHTGERPYMCTTCGKSFATKEYLICHERMHTGERPYQCTRCSKRFARKQYLIYHERTHTGEQPYRCTHCSKAFSSRNCFLIHTRTHTGERPYHCTHCSKAFSARSSLVIHSRMHTGEQPYTCTPCGKAFSTSTHLRIHKRIHTGEKPYMCTQCGKAFSTKQYVISHERTHTGEKPLCSV